MKKLLTLTAGALLVAGLASCSSKNNKTGVDNSALKTTLAKEWALKDGYNDETPNVDLVYGSDIINKDNEAVTGAHFTLRLPKADSYDSMVRTHLVELTKSQTATGSVSSNYGVMNSAILSFKSQISSAIAREEVSTSISNKISLFTADVQESYSNSLNVSEKTENQAVYIAYIPALFSYYSGKDDNTLSIISFVLIPVKSEVLTATVSGDTKTYSSDFYNKTKELQYNWTTSGSVIVDKK